MPEPYSFEVRERAEELYIFGNLTYEQVAEQTGVSITQLKRWATEAEPSWTDRRKEYRNALSSIKRNTIILRKRLIEKALTSLDPQDVYAISALENVAAKMTKDEAEQPVKAEEQRIIKTPSDAVDALQEAVERRINKMLSSGGEISMSGVKDMKQALELIEGMRLKYKAPETEETPDDPEARKKLVDEVDKILGVR